MRVQHVESNVSCGIIHTLKESWDSQPLAGTQFLPGPLALVNKGVTSDIKCLYMQLFPYQRLGTLQFHPSDSTLIDDAAGTAFDEVDEAK